ncbi:hypothetical protein K493DRAFT_299073 [Basidiobolus meristosporus CBS 931.73]|uniref:Pyrroline-5-carboxylate reductase catalytic N-terminal domain-containing protein n=1 Tax=Basidiobolus meristosporus CBS 931.73 TaxID=1314790 RepID=A0A1Y1YQJ2_9FUNG|nr:hypothetical protein K493DRAFT_299073 [Basidiobolus meristosporus CBS 931.73]|eukprot:ORY00084.1 hypothetical protein K493DRAFT_299073 [Basidiobolus meristosporus CBS 931.73]
MTELNGRITSFIDMDEKPVVTTSTLRIEDSRIGIIGTGWYGRALAVRLVACGIDIMIGSRDPTKVEFELPCKAVTHEEVISSCSTIFLTIPWAHHKAFAEQFRDALGGKTIIDVSNPSNRKESLEGGFCIAERLQVLLPGSKIVKGFNTISAYSLQNDVRKVNQQFSYTPVNSGALSNAREIEALPLAFFEEWRIPFYFAVVVYLAFVLYVVITEYAIKKSPINDFPLVHRATDERHSLQAVSDLASSLAQSSKKPWSPWFRRDSNPWLHGSNRLIPFIPKPLHIPRPARPVLRQSIHIAVWDIMHLLATKYFQQPELARMALHPVPSWLAGTLHRIHARLADHHAVLEKCAHRKATIHQLG